MVDHQAVLVTRYETPRSIDPDEAAALARLALSPAVPRDASTVVLLRDAPRGAGIEAFLIRRITAMAFAGGMYAFPGGRVDPADTDDNLTWAGPPPHEAMAGLDADPARARALVCAAVRETFEECGVLLAVPTSAGGRGTAGDGEDSSGDGPGSHAHGHGEASRWDTTTLAADRQALENHAERLSDLLTRRSLVLRTDLLVAWARWIAPELEPRRYDTRFFVAALPAGQHPGTASSEADDAFWIRPADALDRFATGTMAMLPPTAFTLADLAAFDSVAAVLAAAPTRDLTPVTPEITVVDGRWGLRFPHLRRPATRPAPGTGTWAGRR